MLILPEKVEVVRLVAPAEVVGWHVLLLLMLLLQLWLLVYRRGEVGEGIREVMPGEAAVACHCAIWKVLPLGSSCAMLRQGYRHAVAGLDGVVDLDLAVALGCCANIRAKRSLGIMCRSGRTEMW